MKSDKINKVTKFCIDVLYIISIIAVVLLAISGVVISFMLWQAEEIPMFLSLLMAFIGTPIVCIVYYAASMYSVCLLAQLYKLNED